MILKLGKKHLGIELYKVYINHDPGMTLTYFTARSTVMYDSYLSKDVHSVLVNFPREYAQESMMLYI